ncbi:MAG: hypothetical protein KC933_16105 [Myxococcales bacterium]|nr:hypothetical protein [Myxococcales bacterium]MCB9646478.1 hypothetical protein [Deltaproteobacteria bacterium]
MSFNMNFNVNLVGGSHLLRALGLEPGGFVDQLQQYQSQLGMLQNLSDSFSQTAGLSGANMLASLLQSGIPGAGITSAPNQGTCPCGHQYAQPQSFDLGASDQPFSFQGLMQRGKAAQFERFLQQNPFARSQVEMMLGGRILNDGAADGRLQVQPFPGGQNPQGSPAAQSATSALDQISRAAAGLGFPGLGFPAMMLGALSNLLGGGQGNAQAAGNGGRTGNPLVDWFRDPREANQQAMAAGGAGNGGGVNGSPALNGFTNQFAPAQAGQHQGAFGMGNEGDASGVLNDPSLTIEDKVVLMLMLIMKKMDKDIEKQANYINDLQQQQNGGGGGGGKGGGKGGGGGGGSNSSIDIESMKLKRMVDKRGQMFDMLRQIIDKYNETAKNMIQSIGR